jgi:hypothetical protein
VRPKAAISGTSASAKLLIVVNKEPPVVVTSSRTIVFPHGCPTKYLSFGAPWSFGFPLPIGKTWLPEA